jgi:subtilisin-like proprotein convertase family protein
VQAARALLGGGGSTFDREVRPAVGIPDNKPAGIVSTIECPITGRLRDIEVTLGITHTYRGDLRVSLISPEGFVARLHDMQGAGSDNLQAKYSSVDPGELQRLARSGVKVAGTWTINVSDNLARDVGTLDRWRLVLRTE